MCKQMNIQRKIYQVVSYRVHVGVSRHILPVNDTAKRNTKDQIIPNNVQCMGLMIYRYMYIIRHNAR